ncbi:MAG: hypothetical protein JRE65_13150 [Deltaproteobacteria bacterium]|nr:hypothetical protein [Deltaproteobacteria bacterium]
MKKWVISVSCVCYLMVLSVALALAESETHTFTLPTGSTYYMSFPVKPDVQGPMVVKVNSKNQINMPEGRTLTANPLFAIIYRYNNLSKKLETMKYLYFMDSVEIRYNTLQADIDNKDVSYVVGVRNTNARVIAQCTLTISYPGKKPAMKPEIPANLKFEMPKNTKPLKTRSK